MAIGKLLADALAVAAKAVHTIGIIEREKKAQQINKAGMLLPNDVIWFKGRIWVVGKVSTGKIELKTVYSKRTVNKFGFSYEGHAMDEET